MCAAGARRSGVDQPGQPHLVLSHRLPRWRRRAANDNRSQPAEAYRLALMLAGMALVCTLALGTVLIQA
ncbi:hypothetical protein [Methylobacterium nigriterrae]|uniref:hypothetical protein n=1 Tax=Methylobacterium nigriterrae TaxID=3127512 RepID=UPI003013F604